MKEPLVWKCPKCGSIEAPYLNIQCDVMTFDTIVTSRGSIMVVHDSWSASEFSSTPPRVSLYCRECDSESYIDAIMIEDDTVYTGEDD